MSNRGKPPVLHSMDLAGSGRSTPQNAEAVQDHRGMDGAKFIRVRAWDTQRAAEDLLRNTPNKSAALGVTWPQKLVVIIILSLIGLALWFQPIAALSGLRGAIWAVFGFAIGFRLLLLFVHFWSKFWPAKPKHHAPILSDTLPIYTLLLPMYKEASVLPNLVRAIESIDYPAAQLDIKLLLEADDEETIAKARACQLGPSWEVLILPDIGPKTKPKALNVGFARALGEFVTIYDAEDRPHPQQLRAALAEFANGGSKLGCVQAPLRIYNHSQNWLTRQFSLEYAAHFYVILPAITKLGWAYPLGGTSNHFRRKALAEVGGWDPHNVTEDADLGFRLAEGNWRAGVIAPPTGEEATIELRAWVGQRSRWIKGFLQTLFVHLRGSCPGGKLRHALGFFAMLGLAVISALSHGFLFIFGIFCLVCWPLDGQVPALADSLLAVIGTGLAWALLWFGGRMANRNLGVWNLLSSVFYWPLQTWAALLALSDLVFRPFHWEKTDHGHSQNEPSD